MLAIISPAKRLNFEDMSYKGKSSGPKRQEDALALIAHARKLSQKKIKTLMGLSDDLASLNHERFQDFADKPKPSKTKPAIFAFRGDVYLGLQADGFDQDDLAFAQKICASSLDFTVCLGRLTGFNPIVSRWARVSRMVAAQRSMTIGDLSLARV